MKLTIKTFIISIFIIFCVSGCNSSKTVLEHSEVVPDVVKSKILDREVNITVYLPEGYGSGEKYPVLYALHGAYGNEWDWFNYLDAQNCADKLISQNRIKPLIIVSTETLNNFILTWGTSDKETANKDLFEEYLCKELVPYIDSHYATLKSTQYRYIGGVSMGGFIALQTALHNPKLFGKAGGHSPASWLLDYSDSTFDNWLYSGEDINDSEDPIKIARKKGLSNIRIFLDCGNDDFGFVEDTRKIHDALIKRGINSTYTIGEGGHSLDYWASNLEKYLEFYMSD